MPYQRMDEQIQFRNVRYTNCSNFWPFISKHLHRNVIAQVKNLNQIKSDVGRARVSICMLSSSIYYYRFALLGNIFVPFRHYYTDRALLCDSELVTAVSHYLRALAKFKFTFPLNSNFLNMWTPSPLRLAGYLDTKQPTSMTIVRHGSGNEGSVDQGSLNGSSIDLSCAMEEAYDISEMSSIAPSTRLVNEASPPITWSIKFGQRNSSGRGFCLQNRRIRTYLLHFFLLNGRALKESWQFPYLSQFAVETGLDCQNEQCNSCARRIGFENEPYKVCHFDGHYYCSACHVDDEFLIPAKVIFNWDFNFSIADRPLFNLNSLNPEIYALSKALSEMRVHLLLQMNHVAAYLLTCRRTVADELNKRLWPKDYLFREVDLYSLTDLQLVSTGKLQKRLLPVLEFGIDHVFNCRLCAQKGFICEVCNQPEVIYPFQLTTTYRCPTCCWVYHKACMQNNRACSRCTRRDALAKEAESSSIDLCSTLPLEDV
ncbi:DUF4206 domain containing protein [Trichuris trichiura]|uniref:DUF4206 domain containing protein n=1 Tax=Trichuris trichiura TaxID=36087 RepID=A0A077ZJ20_TRITR|nr:DUF4206 domain containing protein [Trichuris trichiura]